MRIYNYLIGCMFPPKTYDKTSGHRIFIDKGKLHIIQLPDFEKTNYYKIS